jgi:hypothetical protein
MAGLLDNKSRVMDTTLTFKGRETLLAGGMNVKYVSFSDAGAVYENDGNGIAAIPIPVGLETFNTANDEIIVTTNRFGDLEPGVFDGYSLRKDGSFEITGDPAIQKDPVMQLISSGSIESFSNQRLITTKNVLFEDEGLSVSPESLTFSITDTIPFNGEPEVALIDDIENLFADRRFGKLLQFQYLPPVQRTITSVGNEIALGNYANVREDMLTEQQIIEIIATLETQEIVFSKNTEMNELGIQFFQSSSSGLEKLDIVKYDQLATNGNTGRTRTLYFIGKTYEDSSGNPTFVNMFDLVIE